MPKIKWKYISIAYWFEKLVDKLFPSGIDDMV